MNIKLGKITLDLGGDAPDVQLDLDDLMPIGPDLSDEFTRQPSIYAYVATLAARAEALWIEVKRDLEQLYAETDKEVRLDLIQSNEKVTEDKVKAEVKLRRGYHEALMEELEYREQHLIMQALVRAFEMRAQMLQSLGAHLRAEAQQTGMTISDFKASVRAVTAETAEERKAKKRERKALADAAAGKEEEAIKEAQDAIDRVPF